MLEETFREWELKLRQEGFRQGFVEGFRQGLREARRETAKELRTLVLDILRYRFGPVPQAVRKRVREISSLSDFKKLIRRLMNANSIQETGLLEPEPPG
jgi:hypothetical protein